MPSSSRPLAGPLRLCVPSLFHVARLASLYQSIYLSPRPSLSYSLVSLRSANVTEAPEASHSSDQPSPAALPPRVAPPLELEVAHEVEPLHEAPSGPHVAGQPGQAPVQAPGPIRTDPHTVSASPNSPNYLLGSCLPQLVRQHQSQTKLKASVYPKTAKFVHDETQIFFVAYNAQNFPRPFQRQNRPKTAKIFLGHSTTSRPPQAGSYPESSYYQK